MEAGLYNFYQTAYNSRNREGFQELDASLALKLQLNPRAYLSSLHQTQFIQFQQYDQKLKTLGKSQFRTFSDHIFKPINCV